MKRNAANVVLVAVFIVFLAALITGGPLMGWGMMGWGMTARGMMSGGMIGFYPINPVWAIATFLVCGLAIAGLTALIFWLLGTRQPQDQPRP